MSAGAVLMGAVVRTTTWLTPRYILDPLGHFDLDPCAAPGWPTADTHYILPTDGLRQPWEGRVWLNPPYGAETWRWLAMLADHGSGTALIFARTDVAGFVRTVWERAHSVLFIHGRIRFNLASGKESANSGGAPSCLVSYSPLDTDYLAASGLGTLVYPPAMTASDEPDVLDFREPA